jgi:hypothetical protein
MTEMRVSIPLHEPMPIGGAAATGAIFAARSLESIHEIEAGTPALDLENLNRLVQKLEVQGG